MVACLPTVMLPTLPAVDQSQLDQRRCALKSLLQNKPFIRVYISPSVSVMFTNLSGQPLRLKIMQIIQLEPLNIEAAFGLPFIGLVNDT